MYTITKETSERIVRLYMKEFGIQGCIHRWYNAYGPGQQTHPVRKAVPYFILNTLNNSPLEIWGDGNQTMDLIHIDDIAYLAVEAMNKEVTTNEHTVEIGSGVAITVNELAELIIKLTNSKSQITHKDMRPGEEGGTILGADTTDINKFVSPHYEFKNLLEGMKETIDYYKNINSKHLQDFFNYYNSNAHEIHYSSFRSPK